jgi:hypothetical protein
MLPGSFVERKRACGRSNCHCANGENLHSQFQKGEDRLGRLTLERVAKVSSLIGPMRLAKAPLRHSASICSRLGICMAAPRIFRRTCLANLAGMAAVDGMAVPSPATARPMQWEVQHKIHCELRTDIQYYHSRWALASALRQRSGTFGLGLGLHAERESAGTAARNRALHRRSVSRNPDGTGPGIALVALAASRMIRRRPLGADNQDRIPGGPKN